MMLTWLDELADTDSRGEIPEPINSFSPDEVSLIPSVERAIHGERRVVFKKEDGHVGLLKESEHFDTKDYFRIMAGSRFGSISPNEVSSIPSIKGAAHVEGRDLFKKEDGHFGSLSPDKGSSIRSVEGSGHGKRGGGAEEDKHVGTKDNFGIKVGSRVVITNRISPPKSWGGPWNSEVEEQYRMATVTNIDGERFYIKTDIGVTTWRKQKNLALQGCFIKVGSRVFINNTIRKPKLWKGTWDETDEEKYRRSTVTHIDGQRYYVKTDNGVETWRNRQNLCLLFHDSKK